jgi:hypothetical protein
LGWIIGIKHGSSPYYWPPPFVVKDTLDTLRPQCRNGQGSCPGYKSGWRQMEVELGEEVIGPGAPIVLLDAVVNVR